MGFYGNITNTARTQFQFDRVYPNRSTMEALTSDDGIYAGRYVLIEYETSRDIYKSVYKDKNSKDFFYTSPNFEEETKLLFGATSGSGVVKKDEIVLVSKGNGAVGDYDELWRATKEPGYDNPVWVFVTDVESDYQANYIIDQDWAAKNNVPISRGWDSTVWQKVYMNGREKYVMIAELNTVVPTFDISADAPTMSPITPHFDTNSTNIYYKLHWQPQWGLRVKSANVLSGERLDSAGDPISGTSTDYSANKTIFPSDENTIWARHEYNASTGEEIVYYYDEKNKQWVKTPEGAEVAAAIYYNKAGFDPAKITYSDENLSDTINIAPTGLSGHLYNAHRKNDADKDPREDIQELTVMLPSIGDSVAKMWDIVYGNEEQNNSKDRNLDINWDSTEGLRLVEEEQSGNGFTYSEDKVNTLAGCINSVHDLMGMIIEDVDNEDTILADSMDKIYYYNNKYYRKKQDYEYEKIEINSKYFDLQKVEFPEGNGYSPNTYYYKNGGVYEPDIDQTWDSNKEYYALLLNGSLANIEPENLRDYKKDTYFYIEGNSYIRDTSETPRNDLYYDLNFEKQNLDANYTPNYYYKKELADITTQKYNYILQTAEKPSGTGYLISTFEPVQKKPYVKGKYFYKIVNNNGVEIYVRDNEEVMTESRNYLTATVNTENTVIIEQNGSFIPVTAVTLSNPQNVDLFELTDSNNTYFYKDNENYYYINKYDEAKNIDTYYTLSKEVEVSNFYTPGVFYLWDEKINGYTLEESAEWDEEKQYFLLEKKPELNGEEKFKYAIIFYEPNKYVDENNIIATESGMIEGKKYYYKEEFYIFEDLRKNKNQYALWNNNVLLIPCTVTLAKRTSDLKFQIEELTGFARTLNTIHGLILKINQMLEMGDAETRDLETVQGVINKVNDIIYKFDSLTPQHFVIVDSHGNIHSSDFDTSQSDTCSIEKTENHEGGLKKGVSGDVFAEAATVEDMEDQWITVNIDANAESPMIKVHHNFQPVNDVETRHNKNTGEGNGTHAAEDIPRDIIALKTPIVDKMGHVVGTTIEKVTLPYSYKTISTDGISSEEGTDLFTTEDGKKPTQALSNTIANSTQDILKINPYNKWIQIGTQEEPGNKLEIAHEIHPITEKEEETDVILNYGKNDSTIPAISEVTYDLAGHITEKISKNYKLTLPTISFKNNGAIADVGLSNNESITDLNYSNINIEAGNRWITFVKATEPGKEGTVYLHHSQPGTGGNYDAGNNPDSSLKFGSIIKIPYLKVDNAGHIAVTTEGGFKDNVLTLPSLTIQNSTHPKNDINVPDYEESSTPISLKSSNLTIKSGNKWVTLSTEIGEDGQDTLKIAHSRPGVGSSWAGDNANNTPLKMGDSFKVPYIKVDDAGHVAIKDNGLDSRTLTLPKLSYKNNTGINPASEEVNTELTQINSSHISVESGNRWITMSTENGELGETKLLISHTAPGEGNNEHVAGNNLPNKILTPGESFWIPYIKADNAGHIAINNGGLEGRKLILASTPSLSEERKKQIKELINLYCTNAVRNNFIYEGSTLRNSYLSSEAFKTSEGITKVKINCGLLCDLIWGGVDPTTFTDYLANPSQFTGNLKFFTDSNNATFDWGYQFIHPLTVAKGVRHPSNDTGYYGMLSKRDESNQKVYLPEGGTYNSYYDPSKNNDYHQHDYSFATCADAANELYLGGYEIQMKDVETGDLLFFNARNLSDEIDDYDEGFRFRNITHVAIVYDVIKNADGTKVIHFAESTNMSGSEAISLLKFGNLYRYTTTRGAYLFNHIAMVARHPAAFDKQYKSNLVENKFNDFAVIENFKG